MRADRTVRQEQAISDFTVGKSVRRHLRRSQLVRLTAAGRTSYAEIDAKQVVWVNRLAAGIGLSDLRRTARVLADLSRRLEADSGVVTESTGGGDE